MSRFARRWSVVATTTLLALHGCVGGGAFFQQRLVGKYALWAMEGLADCALVEESENGAASRVLVGPTVFSAGFDDRFIIVARHPETGPLTFDRNRTEYYVVTLADGAVHGPVEQASFPEFRLGLQVPPGLEFSVTLEQLARGRFVDIAASLESAQ